MEELNGDDEDEEERARKDKRCVHEDTETDSGTYLSVRSNRDDVDDKLPVADFFCGTTTDDGQRKEDALSVTEEKRFLVYICGGYKGKNQPICFSEHLVASSDLYFIFTVVNQSLWCVVLANILDF